MTEVTLEELAQKITDTMNKERESIINDCKNLLEKVKQAGEMTPELKVEYTKLERRSNNLKRMSNSIDLLIDSETQYEKDKAFEGFRASLYNLREREE